MKKILFALALSLLPTLAHAQCTGQAPTKTYCGNDGLTTALPTFRPISSMPFPNIAGGTVVGNNGTSSAAATALTNPILGIPGTSTGQLGLAGATSGTVTIKPVAAAGTYNFNLPTTAGTSGQPLLSGGGGAAAQTYGTLQVPAGGTGLTVGTSGGVPYFNSTTTMASSALLAANQLVIGGGAGAAPATLGSLGTTTTVLHGNAAGAPTFGAVSLTADVSGVLPNANGGTNQSTYTLGDILVASATNTLSKLAGNITTTKQYLSQTGNGSVSASPAWATISGSDITGAALTKTDDTNVTLTLGGTPTMALLRATSLTLGWTGQLALTRGGTNASLTASNGGIVYSTAAAFAILSGTATAGQHLQSGSSAAPSWTTATYPSTAAAGTILAAGTSNTITATATPTLGANGGTGGQITLSGSTSGTAAIRVAAAAGTGTIFQLPANNGSNTFVLQTDGTGITSWVAAAGGGTVTSITCAATLTCTAANPIVATGTIAINLGNANAWTAAQTIQSTSATAFAVGANGSTNPALKIDASAASAVTGFSIISQAAGGSVNLSVISSGVNDSAVINAKGSGQIALQTSATGAVTIGNAGSNAGNLSFFNATSGSITLTPTTGALGTRTITMGAYSGSMGITIASGAKALATAAISSGACTAAQTATATGTLTTDAISATFSADPTATTGYSASTAGMLTIIAYPTADTVNFKVCNNTLASITPGAVTINWRVVR